MLCVAGPSRAGAAAVSLAKAATNTAHASSRSSSVAVGLAGHERDARQRCIWTEAASGARAWSRRQRGAGSLSLRLQSSTASSTAPTKCWSRSYATEVSSSSSVVGVELRKWPRTPPPTAPRFHWEESEYDAQAARRRRAAAPEAVCCDDCVTVPRARFEREQKRGIHHGQRKLRDEAILASSHGQGASAAGSGAGQGGSSAAGAGGSGDSGGKPPRSQPTDGRPFYKKYPPPTKAPEPITFDQPAIPNPAHTAEAHARFKQQSRLIGGGIGLLLLVGATAYAFGAFDAIHLDAARIEAYEGKRVDVLTAQQHAQRRIASAQAASGDQGDLMLAGVQNLDMSAEEMEKQIRAAQKKQAAQGSYALLAVKRSSTIAKAVLLCLWDYRKTLGKKYETRQEEIEALRQCHLRSAERVLVALQKNGGVYVKLGQHASAVMLLPVEWTETLKPLQDQNRATPLPEMEAMFRSETGMSFAEAFTEIDARPIGVASLAQVHRATDRKTGLPVAVKMMHPEVERFCEVDMRTVNNLTALVKRVFPDFEFSWLAEEMDANLPLEMDFRHEAANSRRAAADFARYRKTAVYIPKVPWAYKRVMAMEFIDGRRPDDLAYLAEHRIDRNRVSQELSRCFNQMLYMHGFFHADPHGGNVLIRPAPRGSRSPYNFEVVLLDHGLYFDIDKALRVNYARFWLSLLSRSTPQVQADRRRYAKLVADIDDDLYPILESAVTGRSGLEGSDPDNPNGVKGRRRAQSLLDMDGGAEMTEEEQQHIRKTVMEKEGLFTSILAMLRRVPRRMLMVLKLNDLTRSLDASLHTTHGPVRPFLIAARYCALSIWEDDKERLRAQRRQRGWSFAWFKEYILCWYNFTYFYRGFGLLETLSDVTSAMRKGTSYARGLLAGGAQSASKAASGVEAQEAKAAKDADAKRAAHM